MTNETAIYLKKILEDHIGNLELLSDKIEKNIGECKKILSTLNEKFEADSLDNYDIESCNYKLNFEINQLINLRKKLGESIDEASSMLEFIPRKIVNEIGSVPVDYETECRYIDRVIYIKIPMLPKLYYKKISSASELNKVIPDVYLGRGIRRRLNEMLLKTDYAREVFSEKTLYFLYVYNTDDNHIIDTDGHDTKSVIDEICGFFPGGDNGKQTAVILKTVVSDEVETGTYITVSGGNGVHALSPEEILKRWKNIS